MRPGRPRSGQPDIPSWIVGCGRQPASEGALPPSSVSESLPRAVLPGLCGGRWRGGQLGVLIALLSQPPGTCRWLASSPSSSAGLPVRAGRLRFPLPAAFTARTWPRPLLGTAWAQATCWQGGGSAGLVPAAWARLWPPCDRGLWCNVGLPAWLPFSPGSPVLQASCRACELA